VVILPRDAQKVARPGFESMSVDTGPGPTAPSSGTLEVFWTLTLATCTAAGGQPVFLECQGWLYPEKKVGAQEWGIRALEVQIVYVCE
jgi:hypothetical protein